jgi:hypothetical protein
MLSQCAKCGGHAFWLGDKMVYPLESTAPPPNVDLPEEVRADYLEASTVLPYSPRSSAALLRLGVQKLCAFLGESERDLNAAIGALVDKGLPVSIQQALDVVRVIGNNAVHPGEIDLRDDQVTAASLFQLVNVIAESMISQPKAIAEMFSKLPEGAKEGIAKRDA